MRTVLLVASALIALAFAGCAAEAGDDATVVELSDGSTVELAEGGAISGVVVDEAIRPLVANVSVLNTELTVASDATGLFAIPDLEAGLYTLSVAAEGYLTIQTTAEVVEGQTAKVRIVLGNDPTPRPYHTTYSYDWYDDAGVVIVDFAIDLVDRGFLNDTAPPACDVCYFEFQTDGPVDTFVIEAVWEDTVAPPHKESQYYWSLYGLESGEYLSEYFYSPGRAEAAAGPLGNETSFGISLSAEEEWITMQQRAQLFVTAFYLAPPPDGWSFVNGDR